jgi:HK97 family phage major capsid protein
MYWRLPQVYRANAVWVMNSADIETLTGVKDTTGRPIIQEATEGGLPTIKGRPVLEINQLTAGTIVFGDWRHYFVGDRERMSVETSTEEGNSFARHQIAIKVVERLDGKLALTNAFVKGSIS